MSALIHVLKRTERVVVPRLPVIMLLLLTIAAAGAVMLFRVSPQAIEYPQRFLTPTPGAVCPGEDFVYRVDIKIDETDAVSRITEGWCRVADGICPRAFQSPPVYVNFVEPYSVSTPATRTVPIDLPPGDWQFRHCNETHATGKIDVVCYAVNIQVLDCEAKP
jgi:hypothetical protein